MPCREIILETNRIILNQPKTRQLQLQGPQGHCCMVPMNTPTVVMRNVLPNCAAALHFWWQLSRLRLKGF